MSFYISSSWCFYYDTNYYSTVTLYVDLSNWKETKAVAKWRADSQRTPTRSVRTCTWVRSHALTRTMWREQGSRVPSSPVYQQAKCVSRTTASAQCGVSASAICRARSHFYMRALVAPGSGILSLKSQRIVLIRISGQAPFQSKSRLAVCNCGWRFLSDSKPSWLRSILLFTLDSFPFENP